MFLKTQSVGAHIGKCHPGSSAQFKHKEIVREGNAENREIRNKIKTFLGLGKRIEKRDLDDIRKLKKAIKTELASEP